MSEERLPLIRTPEISSFSRLDLAKNLLNYNTSIVTTAGTAGFIYSRIRVTTTCKQENLATCSALITKESLYLALAMSWLDLGIQCFTKHPRWKNKPNIKNLDFIINNIRDFAGNFIFTLYLAMFLQSKFSSKAEISELEFFLTDILPSLITALISNNALRYRIFGINSHNTDVDHRSRKAKIVDSSIEAYKGFAAGRGWTAGFEGIIDGVFATATAKSLGGTIARYAIGGANTLFQGCFSWKYPPNINDKPVTAAARQEKVQSILSSFLFFSSTITAIANSESPHWIILMTGFSLLALSVLGVSILRAFRIADVRNQLLFRPESIARETIPEASYTLLPNSVTP